MMKRLFAQSKKDCNISNQYFETQKDKTKKLFQPNDEHGKQFFAEVEIKIKS